MKNILKITAIAAILLAVSCGKNKTETVDNRPIVKVKVSNPTSVNETFFSVSGKVEAEQNANVSTRIMGFVDATHVKVGDKVSKGQLLISINSSDILAQKAQINASITEATVAFTNAEKDYNRYTSLFNEQSASLKELDDVTANYKMSKARLEAANQLKNQVNAQLSYSNIRAPFSGIITGKYVNKGDMANPGIPLISLENPSKFQVIAMVSEAEITSIKKGSSVSVVVKSTSQLVKGKVTEISSSTKNTGGQYLVKILLDKTNVKLLSGMFTSVQFPTKNQLKNINHPSLVLVPQSALIHKGQLSGVYTIGNENVAILRWVRIGKKIENQVEILSGLSADEQFIISAEGKLFNGVKVSIQ
jgi:RND family efflux transporter MFP subunit